jgi:hypothetical protein
MRKFLAALATIFCAGSAMAGPGMTNPVSISSVGTREVGVDVYSATSVTSSMACTNTAAVRISTSAANYKGIVSGIMTAFAAGKTIKFWVTQCDSADGMALAIAAWIDR